MNYREKRYQRQARNKRLAEKWASSRQSEVDIRVSIRYRFTGAKHLACVEKIYLGRRQGGR